MEMFQEVAESQKSNEENKDATAAADALDKLSVEEKKTEEKAVEESPAAAKEEETKTCEDKKEEKPDPSTWGLIVCFLIPLAVWWSWVSTTCLVHFDNFLMLLKFVGPGLWVTNGLGSMHSAVWFC